MKITLDNTTIDITPTGKFHRVTFGDEIAEVEILRVDAERGRLDLIISTPHATLPTQPVTAYVSSDGAKHWVTINGQTFVLTKSSGTRKSGGAHHHAAGELTAPMPGQIRAVNISEGDAVAKGQTLMILEAMKMEIRIQSPVDGVVSSISVNAGQTVEREQILIKVEG